jgi:hypothetical protein
MTKALYIVKETIMKTLIAALTLTASSLALASPHHHGHRHHAHRHWHSPPAHHWIVPALIGGAVVYAATRPDPVVVQQPVIIQQPLQPNQVIIDGVVYTKQIMILNGVQQEVLIRQ